MGNERAWRRLLRWTGRVWRGLASVAEFAAETVGLGRDPETHTAVTFRAVTDAVLPETPALGDDLGPEHVPGGLAVGLDEFHADYVDDGFQFGLPHVGFVGNAELAHPVAHVLDDAAEALVARGKNESAPDSDRAVALAGPEDEPAAVGSAAGPFAALSRADRLRAIALLDEFEVEVTTPGDGLFELDAGLVGQLVIGFAEMIYYSEWEGYDEFDRSPSHRVHPNDPSAVQSWRQTGYPGFADGYAALRGYVGTPDGPLGNSDAWTTIDADARVRIAHQSGSFHENEYDTTGYEDPYPE